MRKSGSDPAGNRTRLLATHQGELGSIFGRAASRSSSCGNRAGRCHWSASFLGDLQFPPPLHSGAAPYSPRFTLIGSQDHDVKSYPILFTHPPPPPPAALSNQIAPKKILKLIFPLS
ncbi:hypothetical protein PR048_014605 [Dryococelus australis]|uniref:Uncharacterized protein n=1 Tax=Dryococelus australis TaxID=614101 RepID=A0ABQ9HEN6_9NEOP|nr:hypothetical protein PR048_014605 [Dryococelus australis]